MESLDSSDSTDGVGTFHVHVRVDEGGTARREEVGVTVLQFETLKEVGICGLWFCVPNGVVHRT